MLWNELKKYKIEDIALYINQELEKNKSLISIASELEVNESSIRKKLTTNGYKRINNQYVLKDDMCNQECNTPKENKEITNNITNVFNNTEFKDNMIFLHNEIDILKNIIEGEILGIYESIIILGKLNMISKDDRHKISDYILKIQDEIKRLETI